MQHVRKSARTGSPLADVILKGSRNGIIPSLDIAWRSRGAPVNDWSPAPIVDKSEPISTTFGCGQAMFPTTKLPPMLSPNLKKNYKWLVITRQCRFFSQTFK